MGSAPDSAPGSLLEAAQLQKRPACAGSAAPGTSPAQGLARPCRTRRHGAALFRRLGHGFDAGWLTLACSRGAAGKALRHGGIGLRENAEAPGPEGAGTLGIAGPDGGSVPCAGKAEPPAGAQHQTLNLARLRLAHVGMQGLETQRVERAASLLAGFHLAGLAAKAVKAEGPDVAERSLRKGKQGGRAWGSGAGASPCLCGGLLRRLAPRMLPKSSRDSAVGPAPSHARLGPCRSTSCTSCRSRRDRDHCVPPWGLRAG